MTPLATVLVLMTGETVVAYLPLATTSDAFLLVIFVFVVIFVLVLLIFLPSSPLLATGIRGGASLRFLFVLLLLLSYMWEAVVFFFCVGHGGSERTGER